MGFPIVFRYVSAIVVCWSDHDRNWTLCTNPINKKQKCQFALCYKIKIESFYDYLKPRNDTSRCGGLAEWVYQYLIYLNRFLSDNRETLQWCTAKCWGIFACHGYRQYGSALCTSHPRGHQYISDSRITTAYLLGWLNCSSLGYGCPGCHRYPNIQHYGKDPKKVWAFVRLSVPPLADPDILLGFDFVFVQVLVNKYTILVL